MIVFASGNKAEIKSIPKADGKEFADKLRMHIAIGSRPGVPAPEAAAVAAPAQDVGARLAALDQLRAVGAITDAEHQARRTAILDSI